MARRPAYKIGLVWFVEFQAALNEAPRVISGFRTRDDARILAWQYRRCRIGTEPVATSRKRYGPRACLPPVAPAAPAERMLPWPSSCPTPSSA